MSRSRVDSAWLIAISLPAYGFNLAGRQKFRRLLSPVYFVYRCASRGCSKSCWGICCLCASDMRCVTAWPKSTFLAACRLVVMLLITGSALIVGIWTVARNAVENRASAAAIQLTLDEDGRFSDVEVSLVGCPTSQVLTVHGTVNSAADLTELKEFIRPLEFKRRVRWRVRIDLTNKVPQRIREKQLSDVSASQLVR